MNVQSELSDWRDLYAAAMFEDDRSLITTRVAEAESAITQRTRELSHGEDPRETAELGRSLHMLELLKKCLDSTL